MTKVYFLAHHVQVKVTECGMRACNRMQEGKNVHIGGCTVATATALPRCACYRSPAMDYPGGLDPYSARQHLLHHTYSPLISVQSSHNADVRIRHVLNDQNVSFLQFLKPYGNNAKHAVTGQQFKVSNTQLITKTYPSFPVRFELSLPELLSIMVAKELQAPTPATVTASPPSPLHPSAPQPRLGQLFSICALEHYLKHTSELVSRDLYLDFFTKIITSNRIVPFETFNHPISQIFVIDFGADSVDDLRRDIVEFRNYNFPKFFQIDDLLVHAFVLYDPCVNTEAEVGEFQQNIRRTLSVNSTAIAIDPRAAGDDHNVELNVVENSTIEEDLQRMTLNQQNERLAVSSTVDAVVRGRVNEYITKYLIPHMERKIRVWDDLVLLPKKSITSRLFSVSKLFFNNNSAHNSPEPQPSLPSSAFNHQENYYHKSSHEQMIRKLADWLLILKDFKYAYSTYDLIKKDYTNDKAWVYVALAQELCVVSLILAQTQQTHQGDAAMVSVPLGSVGSTQSMPSGFPDRNTFRKVRHDIIEPYCDNLLYTFKSRLSLKTHAIKALLVFSELLLCLGVCHNNSWWWNDLIERYLCKCLDEFERHFASSGGGQVVRALLYERLGYAFGRCVYLNPNDVQQWIATEPSEPAPVEDGMYTNPCKLHNAPVHFAGLTKFKKASLWYLLAMRQWFDLHNRNQVRNLMGNILFSFRVDIITGEWYDREDLLLGKLKREIGEEASGE